MIRQASRSASFASRHWSAVASSPTRCLSTALKDSYEHVLVERRFSEQNPDKCGVGLIILNRPKALNALCDDLFGDLIHASTALDQEDEIGCLVLTGSTKAFAAGADIAEMSKREFSVAYKSVSQDWC